MLYKTIGLKINRSKRVQQTFQLCFEFPQHLRGHPCKNQTKMKFLLQGSKIQIVSISAHKQTLVRQERLYIFFPSNMLLFSRKTNFLLSPSGIDESGYNRSKIEHFRSLRISKILRLGKSNQRELFYRLFVFCKM